VDKYHQGQRIGEGLLVDALRRAKRLSLEVGIYAVAVDAKDEKAISFYCKYRFSFLTHYPNSFFLPIATIQNISSKK
jgi:GNAT superfamily N-acetyltransferase